jgi:hypothetical protein
MSNVGVTSGCRRPRPSGRWPHTRSPAAARAGEGACRRRPRGLPPAAESVAGRLRCSSHRQRRSHPARMRDRPDGAPRRRHPSPLDRQQSPRSCLLLRCDPRAWPGAHARCGPPWRPRRRDPPRDGAATAHVTGRAGPRHVGLGGHGAGTSASPAPPARSVPGRGSPAAARMNDPAHRRARARSQDGSARIHRRAAEFAAGISHTRGPPREVDVDDLAPGMVVWDLVCTTECASWKPRDRGH